jgi:hypothetical protein
LVDIDDGVIARHCCVTSTHAVVPAPPPVVVDVVRLDELVDDDPVFEPPLLPHAPSAHALNATAIVTRCRRGAICASRLSS